MFGDGLKTFSKRTRSPPPLPLLRQLPRPRPPAAAKRREPTNPTITEGPAKVIQEQTCAYSGETWPEHMMTQIDGRWVSKKYVPEMEKKARANRNRKRKLIAVVSVVTLVALFGLNSYLTHREIQRAAKKPDDSRQPAKSSAIVNSTSNPANDAQSGISTSKPNPDSDVDEMIQAALDQRSQALGVTDMIKGMIPGAGGEAQAKSGGRSGNDGGESRNIGVNSAVLVNSPDQTTRQPPRSFPQMLLRNETALKEGGLIMGGVSFLAKTPQGKVVLFADTSHFDSRNRAKILNNLHGNLKSWEVRLAGRKNAKPAAFDTFLASPGELQAQADRLGGHILLGHTKPLNHLPTPPLEISATIPKVGEAAFMISGYPVNSEDHQAVENGAILEVNESENSLTIGFNQSAFTPNLIHAPVVGANGKLIGIVAALPAIDDKFKHTGLRTVKCRAAFHFAAEITEK